MSIPDSTPDKLIPGILDNPVLLAFMYRCPYSEIATNFTLPSVNLAPFAGNFESAPWERIVPLFVAGRGWSVGHNDEVSKIIMTVGEELGFVIHGKNLTQVQARENLVTVTRTLMSSSRLASICEIPEGAYAGKITAAAAVPGSVRPIDAGEWNEWGLPTTMPWTAADVIPNTFTAERAMNVLIWLSGFLKKNHENSMLISRVHFVVALAKRGNISSAYAAKVERWVEQDLGINMFLDSDAIHALFVNYSPMINETNIKNYFDHWTRTIPGHAIRIRTVVTHASGSGLTALLTLGKAIRKYGDFDWSCMNALFPGEMTSFTAAVKAVGNNPYYGFAKDTGIIHSTRYKNLSYVAKELLIKLDGDVGLKRYAGWIKTCKHHTLVTTAITSYVDAKRASIAIPARDGTAAAEAKASIAAFPTVYD